MAFKSSRKFDISRVPSTKNADFLHEIGVFSFRGKAIGKIWLKLGEVE